MDKADVFLKELVYIENDDIRNETINLIRHLPDYFFEVAASSTGKYHPEYALGQGGLVRHTQAAVRIAAELLRLEMFKGLSEKKDIIIAALILHDGFKHGLEYQTYARADHPIIASSFVLNSVALKTLPEDKAKIYIDMAGLIASHMGQWNTDWKGGAEILPKPVTKEQSFVHLCDYLASRKFLEFKFEV